MNHKEIRVILKPEREIPADVKRDDELLTWADHVQLTAMRTVAAGVLVSTESLDKAASVLSWSGFEVPAGYFEEDHPAYDLFVAEEEKLQAFVEADEENIIGVIGTEIFRLAATGKMLDEAQPEEALEVGQLGRVHEQDSTERHADERDRGEGGR